MRNLGIKTAYFDAIEKCLRVFPYYKNKSIDGYMVLCAYAKYLACYRMPVTNFAARFETHFGVKPNQMKEEFHTLKELFSVPSVWLKLLRFAMPDVVGDVQGVLDVLTDLSREEAVQYVGRVIFESKAPSKVEYIEEENNVDDSFELFLEGRDAFSSEKYRSLRTSLENIIIESSRFSQTDDCGEVIEELQILFPDEQLLLNEALTAYRASDIIYRPRTISEELYIKLMRVDALDFYDAIQEKSGFINIMLETGFVYELITSPLDLNNENSHVLIFDASIHLLNRWLTDEALDNVRVAFVFSNPIVANFAKVSKRFKECQKRKPETKKQHIQFLNVEDWVNYINSSNSRTKVPKVTTVYMNYIEKSWDNSTAASDFNCICRPHLADEAGLYYFYSLDGKNKSRIRSQMQFENSLELNTYAKFSGISRGLQNQSPFVACYSFGNGPSIRNRSQASFSYTAVNSREGILISLDAHSAPKTQYKLRELPSIEPRKTEQPQHLQVDSAKAKAKNNVEIISFSPEINIKMRKIYRGGKLDGIEAYCHGPSVPKARKSRGMKEGPRIVGSLIGKQIKDEDEARIWTLKEYPYLPIKEGTNRKKNSSKSTIRQTIGKVYSKSVLNKECSLRTFYYINTKIEEDLSNRKRALLKELMMSNVGLIRLKDCNIKALNDAVAVATDDTTPESITEYLEVLHLILQHAVSLNCINENSLHSWANMIKKIGERRRQFREALGKNSLSKNQLRDVYEILNNNASDPKYLGLMIQLFTGLSAREVCALTLDSVHANDIKLVPVTLLKITHEVTSTGELLPFDDLHKYRWIPCARLLAVPLMKQYERIREKNRENDEDKVRLLTYPDSAGNELPESAVMPDKLRELSRKIIKDIGIEPHIIRLSDEALRDKRTDINIYYGEILKSNFEFYNRREFGLLPGEYRYLVGNAQVLVKDKNYIDYSNVHSQISMFDKLEKWGKFIRSGL